MSVEKIRWNERWT